MVRARSLRPAFLLTVSATSACASDVEPSRNPPEYVMPPTGVTATTTTTGEAPATASSATTATASAPTLTAPASATATTPAAPETKNPLVDGKPVRLAADKTCFVYMPFGPLGPKEQRPPGTEPPRKKVPCPAGFAAAFANCQTGVIMTVPDKPTECVCAVGGNPPPPPSQVTCPP